MSALINLYKSALSDKYDTLEVQSGCEIASVLNYVDFDNSLIYVNGFQKNAHYILKENDLCTIRQFPRNAGSGGKTFANVVGWIINPVGSLVTNTVQSIQGEGWSGKSNLLQVGEKVDEGIKESLTSGLSDCVSSIDVGSTETSQSYSVEINPTISGCKNQSQEGKCYPFILGKNYFTPYYIGKPYTTIADDHKHKIYHGLYMLGYNDINVSDVSIGLYKLASNKEKIQNGFLTIDGIYDKDRYGIKLEIQKGAEVSIYNQKVVQSECNIELTSIWEQATTESQVKVTRLKPERFSARYPQEITIDITVAGWGYNDGAPCVRHVLKLEYSIDGGNTYNPLTLNGQSYGGITWTSVGYAETYDENGNSVIIGPVSQLSGFTNQTLTFSVKKTFSFAEIANAPNNTVEIRAYRIDASYSTSPRDVTRDKLCQGIYLSAITTKCYDPSLSNSVNGLVPQVPIISKDMKKTTRLGFEIKVLDDIADLKQLNCMVQALGRIYDKEHSSESSSTWNYGWSTAFYETSNPASMALLSMQSVMRDTETYSDNEIDLEAFGQFYDWCKNYNIKDANGNKVGLQCCGVITKQTKAMALFSQILRTGRGYLKLVGSKYSVFIDKPQTLPVMILNNQNVLEASNSKDFDEEINAYKVTFQNEDNYYQQDEMLVCDDGYSSSSPNMKTESLSLNYQTNPEQIKKNGRYEFAKRKLRPETWTRKVSSEGAIIEIGSLVEIQDDTIVVGLGDGAEVKEIVYNEDNTQIIGIKTDGKFDITDETQSYGIKIQMADGINNPKVLTKEVEMSEAGIYSDFIFKEPMDLTDTTLMFPSVEDIVAFGVYDKICTDAICIGKTDNGDGTYNLSFVPYQEGVYTADTTNIPEFSSNVTLPQRQKPTPSVTYEKLINSLSGITQSESVPQKPIAVSGYIYQDNIKVECNYEPKGLSNAVKYYKWTFTKHDGLEVSYFSADNHYEYTFDRNVDGYLGTSELDLWTVRVSVINVYGVEGESTEPISLLYGIKKSNYTWIPSKPTVENPKALKNGFEIKWVSGINLGTNRYKVRVLDAAEGEVLFYSEELTECYYNYVFNRKVDGYPEKSRFENIRNLENYRVEVIHANDAFDFNTGTTSDPTSLDLTNYGTWQITAFTTDNVTKEILDRTVMFKLNVTTPSNLTYYGNTKFRLSIKRSGIAAEGSTSSTLPVVTPDTDYYKPDLYSDPLATENVDKYKTDEVDGYVETDYLFTQTLPLAGQNSANIANTVYNYKIVAYNEIVTMEALEISVTALCTSLRDIVKAHADYKNLYVEKLSAINANIGLISQGGFGDFKNQQNYWALSDLKASDTGLEKDVKAGEFRVGDENNHIQVSYDDETNKAKIDFKTSTFEVTADEQTSFNKDVTFKGNITTEGTLTLPADKKYINDEQGIDMQNSDIINANAVYFGTNAENALKGLRFPNSDKSKWHSLFVTDGGALRLATGEKNNTDIGNPIAPLALKNDFWGLQVGSSETDSINNGYSDTGWLRTTENGLIPYQNGDASNGHSNLGTSTWYFKDAYIQNIHGTLDGNAKTATRIQDMDNPSQNIEFRFDGAAATAQNANYLLCAVRTGLTPDPTTGSRVIFRDISFTEARKVLELKTNAIFDSSVSAPSVIATSSLRLPIGHASSTYTNGEIWLT